LPLHIGFRGVLGLDEVAECEPKLRLDQATISQEIRYPGLDNISRQSNEPGNFSAARFARNNLNHPRSIGLSQ
jgi:hypothetical protein